MTTLSDYLQVNSNIATYQKLTQSEPQVAAQTKYYNDHISDVKTPADLVNNYRLFSYALTAFGIGDKVNQKALFEKVLEQGTSSSKSLANTLNDSRILAFAKTFDFNTYGPATTATTQVETNVVSRYTEQTLEADQGNQDPGVQLALYFKNNAANIKNVYGILADKNVLTVVQTALGISPLTSGENIDTQARLLSSKLNLADFQDPKKLDRFIQQFCASYDIANGSSDTSSESIALSLLTGGGGSGEGDDGNSILSILHG